MRTIKEIEKDLSNVCGGAGYLTLEQIMQYVNCGKVKATNIVKKYNVTYIGNTKGKRYDLKGVATGIYNMQCTVNLPSCMMAKAAR